MAVIVMVILSAGFVIRAYRPVSRSPLWHRRSELFLEAIEQGEWADTYYSPHPGVTVTATGGLALYVFDLVEDTPAKTLFSWAAHPYASPYGKEVAAGVMGLAALQTLLLLAIVLAVRRLAGWPFSIATSGLLSLSPFFLAQGRVFHVDAQVTTFMLLSSVLFMNYLEERQVFFLITSGLAGGLALLTKVPALFLLPFTGLGLLVYLVQYLATQWRERTQARVSWILAAVGRRLAIPLLVWSVVGLLPFAAWPAMWVAPVETVSMMVTRTSDHVENPHPNPRYFAGEIYYGEAPPPTYYPATLAFRTTFVTLALTLVSLLLYTVWRRRLRPPIPPPLYWLMVAFVLFFTIQMGISSKQVDRYILPAQAGLELVAAVGLVGVAMLVRDALAEQSLWLARHLMTLALSIALGLQALVTLPFAPDYGAHYNYLLGGNETASHVFSLLGQDEGAQYIAEYIVRLPDFGSVNVTGLRDTQPQYFPPEVEEPTATYIVFDFPNLQRGGLKGNADWERLRPTPPLMTVSFDGITYLWLYETQSSPDVQTIDIRRGWMGFTVLAWIVVLALAGILVWAVRRSPVDDSASPSPS